MSPRVGEAKPKGLAYLEAFWGEWRVGNLANPTRPLRVRMGYPDGGWTGGRSWEERVERYGWMSGRGVLRLRSSRVSCFAQDDSGGARTLVHGEASPPVAFAYGHPARV